MSIYFTHDLERLN